MTNLLEITGDDVALLSDADLRTLIGRLCEADYRTAGLSTKGIIWGGHQDASDGGLDVVVRSEFTPPSKSFIPRQVTGFQVKKPDMPPAKILKEIKPKGKLREEIKTLLHEHGAYIIISSGASTTETTLHNRLIAMNDAVLDESNHEQLHLAFYDRGQIATWVRSHPPLILWVREKIGRPLQGWQPYSNWANAPGGIHEEYLIDDKLRLFNAADFRESDTVLDGLRELRRRALNLGTSIRLIGLSGVGKTRLVQALFDDRIGEHALNQALAYYTDMSNNPIPDPVSFANQLILAQEKAFLIVDNCSPELHRQLTQVITNSTVSLLTVEYDIQDDLPEKTDVFRLEPASNELIEKLLEKRYAYISPIDATTIAEFASGNARVAIALANTLQHGESLSTLRDEELFKRLFYQKHHPNEDLQISAEICSLVYSFDGTNDSATSELEFLGKLADKPVKALYRDIQELKNRGLIQSRNVWRAVLPHAIANRLAKQALNSIPKTTLVNAFLNTDSERLILSFTRRLGYLHDCGVAVEIANDWLKPNGWLRETNCNFNSLKLAAFKNIAPVAPDAVLSMLESAMSDNSDEAFILEADKHRREFIGLLQHLAYEPELFERSIKLLIRCAQLEKSDINNNSSARSILKALFHIIYSGTHASLQLRSKIVEELVNSNIPRESELGITFLDSALRTNYFYPANISNFGARSRDFGYWPKSMQEICDWFERFLGICTNVAVSDKSIAREAKRVFANNLRGLWTIGKDNGQNLHEMLENFAIHIHKKGAWNEGWIAVKGILRRENKGLPKESLDRLEQLEISLRPTNLLEKARAYALSDKWLSFDLEDEYEEDESISHWEKIQRTTRGIGVEVIQDIGTFKAILPELVTSHTPRLDIFGEGLADGCDDRQRTWQMMYTQLKGEPPEKRSITVLLGFLSSSATHDPDFYNAILDDLVEDEVLGQWFPYFQMTSAIDTRGFERLHKSLDSDNIQISSFQYLAFGHHHVSNDDDNLASLIQKLITKDGGLYIAIEILSKRFQLMKDESVNCSPNLIAVGCDVLSNFSYDKVENRNDSPDYDLAQIAKVCLDVQRDVYIARKICQTLADGFRKYRISTFDYPRLLHCLAQIHPHIFLDEFIDRGDITFYKTSFDDIEQDHSPVNQIPENVLLDWCKKEPEIRYAVLVSYLQTYWKPKDGEELSWKPIIYAILEKAPNVQAVLLNLQITIYPTAWSGSKATILETRQVLFTTFYSHINPLVRDWAKKQNFKLQSIIKEEKESELKRNQESFERFE